MVTERIVSHSKRVRRHGSRERLLTRVCGTVPYAAPEVLRAELAPYRAPPADLWSAALVLLAMLAGELPWMRASEEDRQFSEWGAWAAKRADTAAPAGVWRKLDKGALALMRRALHPDPARRLTLQATIEHRWFNDNEHEPARPREGGTKRVWSSQPLLTRDTGADFAVDGDAIALSSADLDALLSYSQPAHSDDLLLSQPLESPGAAPTLLQRLVRRITRVWTRCNDESALRTLCDLLDEKRYLWRRVHPRILAIDCGDGVKMRAWALPLPACEEGGEARAVLEFRRSRGCGLAFKRRYLELRSALQPLAAPPPPLADALTAPLHALAPASPPQPMDMDMDRD
ncbi:unnamed protein product [Euphydryas editha]|uniref:non-specific serine/threonine protein kinase n=1 Tax=Euphydryas editha TaxID=104508 RepID=A0AAU9VCH7_EUPED|nr:unnamed protein product [Euphydryas editha]